MKLRRPGSELDPELPVLILSGRAGELDRVRGLERGADDYLAKPFSYPELRLRLAALLRRTAGRTGIGRIRVRGLELDPRSREVWVRGEPIHLSRKEFALLALLARAPTYTYTRAELLREVWGFQTSEIKTRTLDSHAHRLRIKLSTPTDPYIVNVWGQNNTKGGMVLPCSSAPTSESHKPERTGAGSAPSSSATRSSATPTPTRSSSRAST